MKIGSAASGKGRSVVAGKGEVERAAWAVARLDGEARSRILQALGLSSESDEHEARCQAVLDMVEYQLSQYPMWKAERPFQPISKANAARLQRAVGHLIEELLSTPDIFLVEADGRISQQLEAKDTVETGTRFGHFWSYLLGLRDLLEKAPTSLVGRTTGPDRSQEHWLAYQLARIFELYYQGPRYSNALGKNRNDFLQHCFRAAGLGRMFDSRWKRNLVWPAFREAQESCEFSKKLADEMQSGERS